MYFLYNVYTSNLLIKYMNNYLQLLGNDLFSIILENVLDLYEKDILLIEKRINNIKNKMSLYHNNKRLYRIWFKFFG